MGKGGLRFKVEGDGMGVSQTLKFATQRPMLWKYIYVKYIYMKYIYMKYIYM
jgi:hypothetical protein